MSGCGCATRSIAWSRCCADLQAALIDRADEYAATIMPGFTHLQTAQPITFGHHLMAYVEMFGRDRSRCADCRARLNESPLGAAALAGSPHPIDPRKTAKALGFERPMANSLDAVSDRDYVVEFIAAASLTAVHLSRLSEEIVIWCSAPFRFIALSDAFTTGSSIMPQKRNPDAAELTRAKVGRIVGAFVALCTILKGLPLTYGKDMQEDKEPLFDAADSLELGIAAMTGMVRDLKANPERMRAVASADYSVATDLADWLVRKVGLPFRQAHHVTGRLVGIAADKGVDLDKLTLAEMQAVEPKIDRGVYRVLTVEASVNARKSLGGTAPANVVRAVAEARRRFLGRGGRAMSFLFLQERRDARRRRGARHHRGPGRHAVLLLLGRRPARGVEGIRRRHQGHERRGLLRHEGQLEPGGGPPVRRAGRGRRHRLGGRDAPRAGGRHPGQAHHLFRRRQEGRRS